MRTKIYDSIVELLSEGEWHFTDELWKVSTEPWQGAQGLGVRVPVCSRSVTPSTHMDSSATRRGQVGSYESDSVRP